MDELTGIIERLSKMPNDKRARVMPIIWKMLEQAEAEDARQRQEATLGMAARALIASAIKRRRIGQDYVAYLDALIERGKLGDLAALQEMQGCMGCAGTDSGRPSPSVEVILPIGWGAGQDLHAGQ
jgi:hypothetical protein